ncbi:hypothetical protein SAMN04488542_104146 [Fontibacillus panacisegetis]|uniref:Short chain dehydrogenase n=1 Tax=Fontibacillus panacisegetis TaxID=670482 RepID=A0A1G7HFU4_9BACL|nr:hypothetical protein [Fontibacillus panacisegetis]SDE99206.1 hypothetical protein SAMN04488542_104146 [Fontibacillus panacisegetis]
MKTLAIIGAGKGSGLSLAKRFDKEGFQVALPDMLAKKEGALLFTTGLSSLYPMPMLGNLGIAMSALRNYVANLQSPFPMHNDSSTSAYQV